MRRPRPGQRIGCPFERGLALAEGDLDAQRAALAIFEGLGARPAAHMLREKMLARGVKGISTRRTGFHPRQPGRIDHT